MPETNPVDINSVVDPTWIMIFTRPSTDVPWFWDQLPPTHKQYLDDNFRNTGKFRSESERSEDQLTISISYFFNSEQSVNDFVTDEYLSGMVQQRDQYNLEHGIERLL